MSLEQLEAPAFPASNIIQTQVNEITQPSTSKDLSVAILNNFLDSTNNVVFPENFALEFNPYQLGKMRDFNYYDYKIDDPAHNIWREFSISMATTTNFILGDSVSSNAMGIGLRTKILRGKINEELKTKLEKDLKDNKSNLDVISGFLTATSLFRNSEQEINYSLENVLAFIEANIRKLAVKNEKIFLKQVEDVFELIPDTTSLASLDSIFEDIYDNKYTVLDLNTLRSTLERVKTERYGLKLDINYAHAINFPGNNWSNIRTSQVGAWFNLSYRPQKIKGKRGVSSNLEFTLLGRFLNVNQDFIRTLDSAIIDKGGKNYDLGLQVLYDRNKVSVELEYIHRMSRSKIVREIESVEYSRWEEDFTNKLVCNVNYNISRDIVLTYYIGKNYDSNYLSQGDFISGISLNFGFGGYKIDDLNSGN